MSKFKIEKSLSRDLLIDRELPGIIGKVGISNSYFGSRPVTNLMGNHIGTIEKSFNGSLVFKRSYSCLPPAPVFKSY